VETYKQRKHRNFEEIKTRHDVVDFLRNKYDRKLHIKYSLDKREAKINEYLDDDTLLVVTDPEFEGEDTIVLYGLMEKYFEIDLKVEEKRGPGYFLCSIIGLKKAMTGRRDLRFRMTPEKVVATNFKISKHTIDISDFKIPTTIKVVIDQFQNQYIKLSDIVRIDVFQTGDPIYDAIKKTGKTLYIEDVANRETYAPLNDNFVDTPQILGDSFAQYAKKNVEKGYKSIIISPIIYITEMEQSIPFAYFEVISKNAPMEMEQVLEVKELSFKLVDRIRDANTLFIPQHQQVVDISLGGAKLMFTDENLKRYLPRAKGFIFDVVFKLQAPITIYGEIRHMYTDSGGNLFVGVDFAGNSSRKDEMKRFTSVLKPMEVDYKNRLLKEMKARAK
jgi:hypothetical protein